MKLEKVQVFILQFRKPPTQLKTIFQDANFLSVALTIKDKQQFLKMKSEEIVTSSEQIINNSGFVSIKFNFFFLISIFIIKRLALNVLFQTLLFFSKHFRLSFPRKLQLSRFYFSVIFCRRRDQTKQILAVTLLFQCNSLLVVGADNLV